MADRNELVQEKASLSNQLKEIIDDYNIKATIDSGIEIPYYDFNGNGRLDKANEKMWLNALIRQVETGFNNLNNDQLDRLKYENSKDKIDYNVGSYRKITVVDVVRILYSG